MTAAPAWLREEQGPFLKQVKRREFVLAKAFPGRTLLLVEATYESSTS